MRFSQDIILNENSVSSDVEGQSVDIRHLLGYALQVEWESTTASADVYVQGSNDKKTWINIGSPVAVVNNDNGASLFNVAEEQYYGWIRIFIDYGSGTVDTVKVTYVSKGM